MNKFIKIQTKKIEIDKWCAGFSLHRDPGKLYVLDWIFKNAAWFRQEWNQSLCKSCQLNEECGFNVLRECDIYKKDEKL